MPTPTEKDLTPIPTSLHSQDSLAKAVSIAWEHFGPCRLVIAPFDRGDGVVTLIEVFVHADPLTARNKYRHYVRDFIQDVPFPDSAHISLIYYRTEEKFR